MTNPPVSSADLAAWECRHLLDQHTIGRLCIVDAVGPIALPVSYRIFGSSTAPYIVFRTNPQSSLGNYSGPAALEVDEIDEKEHRATSVIARGVLSRVEGPHQLADPQPWITDYRDRWLTLDVNTLTGRRFVARANPEGFAVDWQVGL